MTEPDHQRVLIPPLPPREKETRRWEKILGAVGLLVLGAVIQPLGGLIVSHFATHNPKAQTEPVFTAEPNELNYNYVFKERPDRDAVLSAIRACMNEEAPSMSQAKLIATSSVGCQSVAITEAGGIAPLGVARIVITNPTSQSLVITQIRSVTDSVEPAAFVEYWSNPSGGQIGDDLVFDLDAHTAPALLEGPNQGADATVVARPQPYFDSKSLEIPAGRSESIFVSASGRQSAIYKWHLEVSLSEGSSHGAEGKSDIYRVSPPVGEFVGAHIGEPSSVIPVFLYSQSN